MDTANLKSFHYLESGEITFSILETVKSTNKLDPGLYSISYLPYPESKIKVVKDSNTETTKAHSFPDKEKIDALVSSFFDESVVSKVDSLGFYHKTGILFHGKEGTGKSSIMKYYYTKLIREQNAVVLDIKEKEGALNMCWEFVTKVRKIQNNPIVIILDEFDEYLKQNEGLIKTIIDGGRSINKCIFMASTNYIENIPNALKNRPSRFKYVLNIEGIQCPKEVFDILHNMIGDLCTTEEIQIFSKDLAGSTLDEIKQFALDKIMNLKSYSKKKQVIGFSR